MAVEWPKTVKVHILPRLIWAAKSSRCANLFHPSHFARYTSFRASQLNKYGRWVAKNGQNTQFATFNLGRKKFARQNFFHPSNFARYTSFTASQLNKNGRWVAKNGQNTQIATFNLGRKKFARRELFSSQPFCTLNVFYGVPTEQKWPLSGQKQSKHTICYV